MDRSYVTMERHVCPVCGQEHGTGKLLLDKSLRERFERYTVTGQSLCPEHTRLRDEGYIFVVGVEGDTPEDNPTRTGVIASIRREAYERIFDKPLGDGCICMAGPTVMEFLESLVRRAEEDDDICEPSTIQD